MASGFKSLHPLTEEMLRNLGVKSSQVTQGYGNAAASAGYHAPVGEYHGRKFSHCFDLTSDLATTAFMHRLWEAGVVAFARNHGENGWSGSPHIHAIHIGINADDGKPHLLNGPRLQIVDFLKSPPRNGLVGHWPLTGIVPDHKVQAELRKQYAEWLPDYPTRVLAPGGQQINCYAWMDGETVTCEVDAFSNWWGSKVPEDVPGETFDGRFRRAPIRQLAAAVGVKVQSFKWGPGKLWAEVQLSY